ncbi:hypothetical protein [Brucella inopinata]|uniref:hypothetical protein n=1 Tax=Brucella inopinata TaxID=1218315 RepID=UPI000870BCAC|nr:hypothetical protein [Brucella inopinata]SCD24320.1 hypothetical protein BR141012304_11919 [Brucella inopinata]
MELNVHHHLELMTGTLIKVLAESLGDAFKEIRAASPERSEQILQAIQSRAVINLKNMPMETIPDDLQLMVIETARTMVETIFDGARRA